MSNALNESEVHTINVYLFCTLVMWPRLPSQERPAEQKGGIVESLS